MAAPLAATLPLTPGAWGDTPISDLLVLALLTARAKPHVAFEFGTFTGVGTVTIASNGADDCVVHTLDLGEKDRRNYSNADLPWELEIDDALVGSVWHASPYRDRIVQHFGDSRQFERVLRGTVDFAYIDAGHTYELVANDTDKALQMTRPGATLVWHDYSRACPDVARFLVERREELGVIAVTDSSVAFGVAP